MTGYTSHGHPIPGACGIAGQRPKYVARCGGPRLCGTCSLDAERYNESRPDSNEPPTMTDQTPTCPTCGIDLRYPTGLHIVDCPATQTDQAPSTEDVRVLAALNAYYNVRHYGDTKAIAALDDYHSNNVEAMRAAVRAARNPAHDREVAAKALREMSRKLVEMRLDPNLDRHASDYWSGVFQGLLAAEQYVSDEAENARADRIEAGTYLPPTH